MPVVRVACVCCRAPGVGVFGWWPARQVTRQASVLLSGNQNRWPGSAAWQATLPGGRGRTKLACQEHTFLIANTGNS
jgi:hypothetical protein